MISSGTAYAKRYAEFTQMTSLYEAPRPSEIAGIATETMVESTRIMKKPSIMLQRAGHGERVEVSCTGEMILGFA